MERFVVNAMKNIHFQNDEKFITDNNVEQQKS